ncbi:hypothetical protein ACSAZL_19690 [Methanosarcina sp. T3]|uniref:hypothetical protein n=1 Tax=Methanosarcina sp. T3 TaxID=3439062 RepID=UPI003F86C15B
MTEVPDFNLQISLLERNSLLYPKIGPLERSEKGSVLQSRNSAETDLVLPRRNSGCRAATLPSQLCCPNQRNHS